MSVEKCFVSCDINIYIFLMSFFLSPVTEACLATVRIDFFPVKYCFLVLQNIFSSKNRLEKRPFHVTSTDGELTINTVSTLPFASASGLRELIPSMIVTLVLLIFCNLSFLSLSGSLQSALG